MSLRTDKETPLQKAVWMPCLIMAACAVVMGIGYALCPETMQGGNVLTKANRLGVLLVRCGGALYDNIGMVFACFAASAFLDDSKESLFLGLAGYLMVTAVLSPSVLQILVPAVYENEAVKEAFSFISGPPCGICAGLAAALAVRLFKAKAGRDTPLWMHILVSVPACMIAAALLGVLLPLLYIFTKNAAASFFTETAGSAAVFAFVNRLLTPFGLNHAVNSVVLSDRAYIGDLTRYWANETGQGVGMFMGGFFAPMMFGIPGALLAVYCREGKRNGMKPVLIVLAMASFICGASEPAEFLLLIFRPLLFVSVCVLYGVFAFLSARLGFRAGFAFSGGLTDLIFSSAMAGSRNTWMILPLGALAFASFFALFFFCPLHNRKEVCHETE